VDARGYFVKCDWWAAAVELAVWLEKIGDHALKGAAR
jgi:hypothetical protein